MHYADAPVSYTQVAGCMSACDKYGDAKYCCTGNKNSPDDCGPSRYSKPFKEMCPDAYTYAYDDATSTFATATGPEWSYEVVFCPGYYLLRRLLIIVGESTDYLHGSAGRLEHNGRLWVLLGFWIVTFWLWTGL